MTRLDPPAGGGGGRQPDIRGGPMESTTGPVESPEPSDSDDDSTEEPADPTDAF